VIDIEGNIGSTRDNGTEEDDPETLNVVEEKITTSPHSNWRREQLTDEELGYFYDTAWTVDSPISINKYKKYRFLLISILVGNL
jgi:hypothetical protein